MCSSILISFLLALPAFSALERDFTVYEPRRLEPEALRKASESVKDGAEVRVASRELIIAGSKAAREATLRRFAELDHPLARYHVQLRAAGQTRIAGDTEVTESADARLYDSTFGPVTLVHARAIGESGVRLEFRERDLNIHGDHALLEEVVLPLGEWRTIPHRSQVQVRADLIH